MADARKWGDLQSLVVMLAVHRDHGYSANIDIECPICHENTLSYEKENFFRFSAWCSNCESGIKQGNESH